MTQPRPKASLPVLNGGGGLKPVRSDDADALAKELVELIEWTGGGGSGHGEVRFDPHNRMLYATDASLYQVEPIGIVIPGGVDQAAAVVAWAGQRGVALLPRGGGTSLAGQCTNRAIVLDCSAWLRGLSDIDTDAGSCVAESGLTIEELNEHLTVLTAERPMFFAPDPATTKQATVGGCIGNNAAGARSILYGRTSENILGIEVALSTGERVRLGPKAGRSNETARRLATEVCEAVKPVADLVKARYPKTVRRNAGYALDMIVSQLEAGITAEDLDLTPLLCGSEGTLAVTLRAKLRLRPAPRARGLAVVSFDTLEEAIGAVVPILKTGPSAIELLDDVVIEAARANPVCRVYVDELPHRESCDPQAALYVEYFGESEANVTERFADLRAVVGDLPIVTTTSPATMLRAWALRKAGEPLLHGLAGDRKPVTFVEDNAVPVERLGEFVARFKEIVARHGTRAAYWAHASVGVLHVRPMIDLHDPADRDRMRAIAVEVADLARELGGIMSGEHGDGRVRGPLLERFFGSEIMGAFRAIKRVFDPAGIMNPGNIVSPGPISSMTSNLRVLQDVEWVPRDDSTRAFREIRVPRVDTYYEYRDLHGFGGAVEQCNGAGVCRKRSGGTMCPSYMATQDERHSTRGRGNALRLAITGQLARHDERGSAEIWDDPGTIDTLNLCLSCKACKAECPSNVDIARLKAEYTAQRFRSKGRLSLKAMVLGRVRALNRLGSMAPGIANMVNRSRPVKRAMSKLLGVSERRDVPAFSRSLYAWFSRHGGRANPAHGAPAVALFADCFTAYNEPAIGAGATRLLQRLGYRVLLVPSGVEGRWAGCCGRAMISLGDLEGAITTAERTLGLLRSVIDDPNVLAVLFAEPSCLSAVKDDWLDLRIPVPRSLRERLASKSMLLEEFVDGRWDAHPNRPRVRRLEGRAVLHAHCHQKAMGLAASSDSALRRVCSAVDALDAGCCGMAGSFGYDEDKFDLSMAIGERVLLPAVREARQQGDHVVATGTSCRHQIADGSGVRAVHPIELLERAIEADGR